MRTITDRINQIVIDSNDIIQEHLGKSKAWQKRYKDQPEIHKTITDMEKTMVLCKISNKLTPMSDSMLNAIICKINKMWDKEIDK